MQFVDREWELEVLGDHLRRHIAGEPAFAAVEVTLALVSRAGFMGRRALAADERLVDLSGDNQGGL